MFSIMKADVWREVSLSAKELKLVKYEVFQPEKKGQVSPKSPKTSDHQDYMFTFFQRIVVDPYQLYALQGIPIQYVPSGGI